MGEGISHGAPHPHPTFPDTGCPVPDVYFIHNVPDMINVWILGCFRPRTFLFEKRIG